MSLKKTLSKKCNHSFGNEDGNSKMMSFGWPEFIEWEGMRKDYWMDDKLIVEAHVSIKKMTGFYGENLKNFDAMRDFSDENTVEALLSIGAALTTPSVVDRCEKYLIEKSRKTLKKRLQLALKYNLEKLKSHCFESMKSNSDVRSVIPRNLSEIDRQMLELLLQKALSFG
uniref:MATH domain-containing protein n=1 Tax=Caenorhabditis tropicalis TaxID=1561998 RepID=A0A1I7TGR8_9PELO